MDKNMAFLSYATLDDEYNNGWITRFKTLLSKEVEVQTGSEFNIFLYKDSIGWGENWYNRIMKDIGNNVAFFISIISPSYLRSEYCRHELEAFLKVEEKMGRNDLLLPIHFIGPRRLEEINDELVEIITKRTYVDWRELRHIPLESIEMRMKISNLASRIVEILQENENYDNNYKHKANHSITNNSIMPNSLLSVKSDVTDSCSVAKDTVIEDDMERDYNNYKLADEIISIARLYRKQKPLTILELLSFLKAKGMINEGLSDHQFRQQLLNLQEQRRLMGIVIKDDILFAEEEHYTYKTRVHLDTKKKIAKKAVSLIKSGNLIILDSGSTSKVIAEELGHEILLGNLENITVVTNFIENAHVLLSISGEMGLEDENDVLKVYLVGGRIRSNTLASVGDGYIGYSHTTETFDKLFNSLGVADIAFVGTNGIKWGNGFTTTTALEADIKKVMLKWGKLKCIVTDPSKFGLKQEHSFANFSEDITIITSRSVENRYIIEEYSDFLSETNTKLNFC